jgi:outer membrane lipoprotein SlyB
MTVACAPDYSPNVYNANAVQQASKVEPGVVVGCRQVEISAGGTVGAVTGAAAGGVLGAQSGVVGINAALGAVGGSAIGGLLGTTIERVAGDTKGWEYIVRKADGEMISVTQREVVPMAVGQKVLVISGSQARIVPDYSVPSDPHPAKDAAAKDMLAKDAPAKDEAKDAPAKPGAPMVVMPMPAPEPAQAPEPVPVPVPAVIPPAAAVQPSADGNPAPSDIKAPVVF